MQQTNQPNPTKVATKWALISLATSIVLTYVFQFMNMEQNSAVQYLGLIPFIVFLFLAQNEYKQLLGGYMTFSQGFSTGFRFAVFSGLLVAVFVYIYMAILSPEVFEKSLAASQSKMAEQGLTSEQIDKAMSISKKYGPIFGAFGVAIFDAIIGLIVALIGAAIFKKERSASDAVDTTGDNYTDPAV